MRKIDYINEIKWIAAEMATITGNEYIITEVLTFSSFQDMDVVNDVRRVLYRKESTAMAIKLSALDAVYVFMKDQLNELRASMQQQEATEELELVVSTVKHFINGITCPIATAAFTSELEGITKDAAESLLWTVKDYIARPNVYDIMETKAGLEAMNELIYETSAEKLRNTPFMEYDHFFKAKYGKYESQISAEMAKIVTETMEVNDLISFYHLHVGNVCTLEEGDSFQDNDCDIWNDYRRAWEAANKQETMEKPSDQTMEIKLQQVDRAGSACFKVENTIDTNYIVNFFQTKGYLVTLEGNWIKILKKL